jgi:hypothetical protein
LSDPFGSALALDLMAVRIGVGVLSTEKTGRVRSAFAEAVLFLTEEGKY